MKRIINSMSKSWTAIKLCFVALLALMVFLLLTGQNPFATREVEAAPDLSPPIGSIIAFAGPVDAAFEAERGWLLCDGRSLNRTDPRFRALFRAIGTTWGGDAATNFNIPDLRGRFIRGVDKNIQGVGTPAAEGGPRDPDRDSREPASPNSPSQGNRGNNLGSMQPDAFAQHDHNIRPDLDVGHTVNGNGSDRRFDTDDGPSFAGIDQDMHTMPAGGQETRPKNAYVFWLIRFK